MRGRLTCPAKFMSYLYILKNKNGKYYTGITNIDPEKRLQRHNKGDVYSTKFGKPWQLIYIETFGTLKEAREREKQIKSWKGGNAFKKFLTRTAGSSNGRTSPFEGEYSWFESRPRSSGRENA